MPKADVSVYVGEALARYGFGADHPFGPDRMGVFWQRMIDLGLDGIITDRPDLWGDALTP